MKTIKYLSYMLMAALPLSLASCAEELEYTPGEPDLENCYGVYFPEQENSGAHQLDPSAPTSLTFTASRLKSEGAITVPVEVFSQTPEIFTVSAIEFADGQEETQFTVSFDASEVGVNYECTIEVTDPQYALVYGSNPSYLNFSITRIKWNKLVGEDGSQTGLWRDDIISSNYNVVTPNAEIPVVVYERDDMPGYYRVENPYSAEMLAVLFAGDASAADQFAGNALGASFIVNATNPNRVYIPYQPLGAIMSSTDGQLYACSNVSEVVSNSSDLYGTLKDGIIEFPAQGLLFSFENAGGALYYANNSGMTRLILPGFRAYDYSVGLQAGYSENGVLAVNVSLGDDVATAKYSVYEGSLSDTEIEAKVTEINNDADAPVFEASGVYSMSFEKTGVYTLVTSNLDAAGTSQGSSSLSFGYVAAGEEVPVVLTTGLVVSDKYAPQGYTSENSMEFYVYGQDISAANMTLFKSSYIAGADPEVIKSVMLSEGAVEDTELSAEQVTTINGNGLSGVFTGLNPNEDYTLAVYASNGYQEILKLVSAKTEGESDPLQITYGMDDVKADLLPATAEGYFGEWNFYAIDGFDDAVVGPSVNNRVSVGKVTISDSAEEDTPDDDYISVKGLVGPSAANYGISDDTFTFSYYNGVVYTLANTLPQAQSGYYPVLMHAIGEQVATVDYAMLGAYVDENHVAFMDVTGMGIDNLYLGMFADADYTQFGGGAVYWIDPLLVKPEAAPSSAPKAKVSKGELKAIGTRFISSMNYVETPEGRIKSAIDEILSQPVRVVPMEIADNVKVTRDARKVEAAVMAGGEFRPASAEISRSGNVSAAVLK